MKNNTLAVWLLLAVACVCAGESETAPSWNWSEVKASPLYCAAHSNGGYELELFLPKSTGIQKVHIRLLDHGKEVYSFDGHVHSVFGIANQILWYADYSVDAQGGTVIAVDLATRKQLWSTRLEGLPPRWHSRYQNLLNIESAITVYGHETFGDYTEILDAKTGKQLKHEVIAVLPKK